MEACGISRDGDIAYTFVLGAYFWGSISKIFLSTNAALI